MVTVVESRSTPCQCTSCTPQLRAEEISLQATVAKSVPTKKPDWSFNQGVVLHITPIFFPSPKDSSFHYRLSFAVNQSVPVSWVRNTCVWDSSSALLGNRAQVLLQELQVSGPAPEVKNEKGLPSWWVLPDFWRSSLLSPSNQFCNYHL